MKAIEELVVRVRRNAARTSKASLGVDYPRYSQRAKPLQFSEFCYLIEHHAKLRREYLKGDGFLEDFGTYIGGPVLSRIDPPYEGNADGWTQYLNDHFPALTKLITHEQKAGEFPEKVRRLSHSLILAGTGSGKSTLIKTLVHHYVANPGHAVIVLDPGGEMVRQIARWPEFARNDRLVYIEPDFFPGKTVGINPLDGAGLDERGRNNAAQDFARIVGEYANDMTANMENLTRNCAEVLYTVPDATLFDFQNMLNAPQASRQGVRLDDRTEFLFQRAMTFPRTSVANFFRTEFQREYYETSRDGIRGRLNTLLGSLDVERLLAGKSTFSLSEAVQQRKVVLVNLAKFGESYIKPVGLLFMAMISALGWRRAQAPDGTTHVPVQLFVDEVTKMAGKRIIDTLNQLRKYGVHLTLAQQVGGENFGTDEKRALFTNTEIKMLAAVNPDEFKDFLDIDLTTLPKLGPHEFWVKWGRTEETQAVKTLEQFAGDNYRCTPAEWQAICESQRRYYRDPVQPELQATPAPPLQPEAARPFKRAPRPYQAPHTPAASPTEKPAPQPSRQPAATTPPPEPAKQSETPDSAKPSRWSKPKRPPRPLI